MRLNRRYFNQMAKLPQSERLIKLNHIAIHQMQILESGDNDRKLLK